MSRLIVSNAILVVGVVCSATGLIHMLQHSKLQDHLAEHQILTGRVSSLVVPILITVELYIGLMVPVFLVGVAGNKIMAQFVMMPALLLFSILVIYLCVVLRRNGHGSVSCGCGLGETLATSETVVRAGLLGMISLVAVVGLTVGSVSPPVILDNGIHVLLMFCTSVFTTVMVVWAPILVQQERLIDSALS